MKTFAMCLAVVVSSSALAAEPSPVDAPLDLPGRSVRLDIDQPAPFAGRLLSNDEHVASEALCADDHAFRKEAMTGVRFTPMQVVAVVAGVLAAGVALGVGAVVAGQALKRP